MAPTASDLHSDRPFPHPHLHPAPEAAVITDARDAASKELASRMRRYTIAMAFRLACFISMAFVDGWLRWTLLAFAVFLPYVAVVLANQSDQRTVHNRVEHGAPADAPALTTGAEPVVITGEVISGEVVDATDDYVRPAA
jgi:type III secretory pathway component EscV